ncbi:hypothetical protein K505DRAFT_416562 [Melanomma pulvis-pyrius CBS 109.77]|uniref:Uncharacterized protein n=1 Tax=Melanomma pulvis-pyrius CBS 109.77 TaxID=1314802 RepID=A0A6A6XI08_9PLEO|nr:hypothetical protein K505DRAFT_416562 [Melanomma pulvis-pyrius CBS 109.77]
MSYIAKSANARSLPRGRPRPRAVKAPRPPSHDTESSPSSHSPVNSATQSTNSCSLPKTGAVCFARRLGVSTTILRTCKQIYGEAIAILYQNGFLVDLDYRKSVLSQSPAVVARLWEEEETPDPVPITIPPAWDVSRITKLHLRIEMHRLRSRLPAHIQTFSYPDLNQMVSLNTLEISVLYTLWSEKWTGRMEKLHDHVRKMAFFRGERENERLSEQLQEFVKYILRSIPKKVNKVVWVDGSEGWRLKRTMPVQLETGLTFLEPLSPSVKPTTPRTCMYVKREVLEMAADEVDVNRGRGLERYRRIVKEVEEEETEPGGGSGRG